MNKSSLLEASVLVLLGSVLLAWLVYDAGSVQAAIGLQGVVSEGTVALAGLAVACGAVLAGWALWRRGSNPDAPGRAL